MDASRLAAATRTRLSESGCDRDGHAPHAAGDDLELVSLADRRLVDVPGEDQLRACIHEPRQHVVAMRDRLLARAPRRADQVVVEDDDAQRAVCSCRQELSRTLELAAPDPSRLVSPGPRRVEPDHLERIRVEERLRRLPDALELVERAAQAPQRPGHVVVAGNGEEGRPERLEKARSRLVLVPLRAVRQVAAGDDQVGAGALHQLRQAELDLGVVAGPEMKVGDVENAGGHDRGRL